MGEERTSEDYLRKAKEIRSKAEGMKDPGTREIMLGMARDYEAMARHLDRRKKPK
jgi:hypothetical protein